MLNLRTLSNDLFTVQVFPAQKNSSSFVILKEDGTFHASGQIANVLRGKELVVLFDKKYELLQISVNDGNHPKETCLVLPKNGTCKIEPVLSSTIKFPVKYVGYFCEKDKVWRGQRLEDPFGKSVPAFRRKKN